MKRDYFTRLYQYTFWADAKVWDCIMALDEGQYTQDLDYSRGSIRDQWVHAISTANLYLTLLTGGNPVPLDAADFPDRASLRHQWEATREMALAYVAALTPDEVARTISWPGRPMIIVWEALTQVAMHSMDHRAQILAGLHQLGAPTVEQDFIFHAVESRQA